MRFGVLGTLSVESGDPPVPLTVAGAKERTLLGRLLVSPGHVVQVDTLLDDVWAGDPPPTARKSLQAHVVRLRTALQPDRPKGSPGTLVVRRGDGYVLAVPSEAVDVGRATAAAANGRAALAAGRPGPARELLVEAESLWRGEPFVDWPDATWAQAARRGLIALRESVVEARLDADLALGRHRESVPELERLVDAEPLHEGWWTRLMVALYRSDRQADALAAGRRARAVLAEELGLDAGPGLRRVEQAILEQAEELDVGRAGAGAAAPAVARPSDRCPYQGLAAYQASDADVFFGRGAAIRAVVARAVSSSLIVVSGASGAGKSSLVRAGLLPALARGAVPGVEGLRQVVITPGPRPVDELGAPAAGGEPVVLVVDQFEELWTAGAPEAERAAFLDETLAALDDGTAARVVLVVRGDHLGRLGEHAELAARCADGIVLVAPLTETELRDVVEGPASVAGLTIDPDLVEAVVRDVQNQPGALPLLSTALVGTWERRRGATLALAGYLEAGGVTAALARTAEAALASLDEPGRALARRMLVRLAAAGEGGVVVRRRVAPEELGFDGPDGAARRAVAEAFVTRRLLSADATYVEVTHEALLTAWPRLAGWLAQDAAGRDVRTRLAPEAREWDDAGRPEDRLYRGARLAAAVEWRGRPDADPTPVERAFVEASERRSEAELAEAHEQARRERAGRRRVRRLAAVLAAVAVLALVAGGLAVQRQRVAVENEAVADANRLAAASVNAPALDLSLLLAVQAFERRATPSTEDGLLASVVRSRQITGVYRPGGVARRVVVSPDGTVLYAQAPGRVVAWDLATRTERVLMEYRSAGEIPIDLDARLCDDPDAPTLAVVTPRTEDGPASSSVTLLTGDGRRVAEYSAADLGGWPMSAEFSADGRGLVVEVLRPADDAPDEGPPAEGGVWATRVELGTGKVRHLYGTGWQPWPDDRWLTGLGDGARSIATVDGIAADTAVDVESGVLDPDSGEVRWLDHTPRNAAGSAIFPIAGGMLEGAVDGSLYWYPPGERRWTQRLTDHTSQIWSAASDEAGTVLVTGGSDGRVVVHRRDADGLWQSTDVLRGHQGRVVDLVVSPGGHRAFSAGEDQTILEWDLDDRARFGTLIPRIQDPDDETATPLVTSRPVLLDDGRTWAFMMIEGPAKEWSTVRRPKSRVVVGFMDSRSFGMTDFVPLPEERDLTYIPLAAVTASPDGRWVAAAAEHSVRVLDAVTHRVVRVVRLPPRPGAGAEDEEGDDATAPEPVATVAWSVDGSRLFVGTGEDPVDGAHLPGALVVVDTATWRVERRVLADGVVRSLSQTPDGRLLALGYARGEVVVIDTGTYAVVRRWTAPSTVMAVAFSPGGNRLAVIGGKRLAVWDVARGRALYDEAPYVEGGGNDVAWLGDDRLALGRLDGQIEIVDVATGRSRGLPLPVYRDAGAGAPFLAPQTGSRVAALPGWRSAGSLREGMSYSLDPADWLAHACEIVSRDLSADEWRTYLPGVPREATCGPPT